MSTFTTTVDQHKRRLTVTDIEGFVLTAAAHTGRSYDMPIVIGSHRPHHVGDVVGLTLGDAADLRDWLTAEIERIEEGE